MIKKRLSETAPKCLRGGVFAEFFRSDAAARDENKIIRIFSLDISQNPIII